MNYFLKLLLSAAWACFAAAFVLIIATVALLYFQDDADWALQASIKTTAVIWTLSFLYVLTTHETP